MKSKSLIRVKNAEVLLLILLSAWGFTCNAELAERTCVQKKTREEAIMAWNKKNGGKGK